MAAASNRYRTSIRRRNPGQRPPCQAHAEKMPRFQDAIPGDTQRAWQRRANPVLIDPLHLAPESTAAECLTKDREALLAFYDFPAEHWKHLRTSNPVESTFATVRHTGRYAPRGAYR